MSRQKGHGVSAICVPSSVLHPELALSFSGFLHNHLQQFQTSLLLPYILGEVGTSPVAPPNVSEVFSPESLT